MVEGGMAYDEGLAQLFRDDLAGEPVREQKMFGGLCFLLNGNMVAGVYSGGGMFRIDKADRDAALRVAGAEPIRMGKAGREMAGMVGLAPEAMGDDARRGALLAMSLGLVRRLPPK
jgi:TfoX/Sxy family transcriptional regulator of competence genes